MQSTIAKGFAPKKSVKEIEKIGCEKNRETNDWIQVSDFIYRSTECTQFPCTIVS